MKANTIEILNKAMELKAGSKLYLRCSTDNEMNVLYADLKRRRFWFIADNQIQCEQVIIDKESLHQSSKVILMKINKIEAEIRNADGTVEDVM